jgi:predicted Na+-dependent transporter
MCARRASILFLDIFYIIFIVNIVNIVQHSHLYNSFLLIIVACIVILLVAILYRDHVGFCKIRTLRDKKNISQLLCCPKKNSERNKKP